MHKLIFKWWTWLPIRLWKITKLLSTTWIDGVYLTTWPTVALIAPLSLFLLGLIEGSTHWSLYATALGRVSTSIHADDFSQMVPLLFVAAICGAFSAQFGLLLVAGFALGDFVIAASGFVHPGHELTWTVFHLYAPQLLSYLVFCLLAVTPTVTSRAMVSPTSLPTWLRRNPKTNTILSGVIACIVQGISVYAWTLAAPMIVRTRWIWTDSTPPLAVVDYVGILDPWLPLAATAAMAFRTWLSGKATGELTLSCQAAVRTMITATEGQGRKGTVAIILARVVSALLATLLISGLFDNVWKAAFTFALILGLFVLPDFVLPKVPGWAQWLRIVAQIPLVFRWAGSIVAAFLLTRFVMFTPGFSAAENGRSGAFGVQIFCFLLSLAVALALLSRPTATDTPSALSRTAQFAIQAVVFAIVFGLATRSAYAGICLDPGCCFGQDSLVAALVVAALVVLAVALLLPAIAAAAAAIAATSEAAFLGAMAEVEVTAAAEGAAAAAEAGTAEAAEATVTATDYVDYNAYEATYGNDPIANAIFTDDPEGGVNVTSIYRGDQPPGSAGGMLADAFEKAGIDQPSSIKMVGITNVETLQQLADGVEVADTKLGHTISNAASELGGTVTSWESGVDGLGHEWIKGIIGY